MIGFLSKLRLGFALGLPNVARAVGYRLGVKLGLNPVRRLQAATPQSPFFHSQQSPGTKTDSASLYTTSVLLFSYWPMTVSDQPPDWLANPFNGQRVPDPGRDWWQIPDFDAAAGDIKLIWELSRFDWVLAFAKSAQQGDDGSMYKLNAWLNSWCESNPPYKGPNWKCGQEASIRVMHLAMAALMLGQVGNASPELRDLVRLHLKRIAPTLQYAMAQDNNHGTSEAAALFIGGSWLSVLGISEGESWAKKGRFWLENRAARLIGDHGSFSQYSVNYHRVLLDTFCMAEVWRKHLGLPAFSAWWNKKALAATNWLRYIVNPVNGDAPNLGANDGARLLQLTTTTYRDYRPSVQLAMALFAHLRAYAEEGAWNEALTCLSVPMPATLGPRLSSHVADDGGFAVLRRYSAMALLRYPRFRFRPSQSDALHLDFWLGADNVLRDAGSYSYNTDAQWLNYFGASASHNTIEFDGRDQMPRISRFLLGDWLKTNKLLALEEDEQSTQFGAGYKDGQGASHSRNLSLCGDNLYVSDEIHGFSHKAVLRWRLIPGDWVMKLTAEGPCLTMRGVNNLSLRVISDVPIARCELVEGWESRHYLEKTPLPVLEIEVHQAGKLQTQLHWTA
jgi:hypothetical protein